MIVAIERNKFTYLYKYNEIRVDINQVIDKPIESLKWMLEWNFNELVQIFNKSIPLFEQDHEIVLLEIDKSKIKLQDGIVLFFNSVLGIYPITKTGGKLLEGKISEDFIVEFPIFESCIETLLIIRSMALRRNTAEKLLNQFRLEGLLSNELVSAIESAIYKNLLDKTNPQEFNSFLDHLIAYNKTPSYIPDGNIENICKIGAIAIKYLGKREDVFTTGPFYKSTLKYKSQINGKSYLTSYLDFISISDDDLKSSYQKMVEIISKDYPGVDIFKVSYFFLAFKTFINKHDNNIGGIQNEIVNLINNDRNSAAFVLTLIGYTFSFENIYEGMHSLSNAPLLKSTLKKRAAELEKDEIEKGKFGQMDKTLIIVSTPSIAGNNSLELPFTVSKNEEPQKVKNEVSGTNISSNPIDVENISEPIVIYESDKNLKESDENRSIEIMESKNEIIPVKLEEEAVEKPLLTINDFRNHLTKGYGKHKQKMWLELLDNSFANEDVELSLEILLEKLDALPELKNKLVKSKKDLESVKTFFDSYK